MVLLMLLCAKHYHAELINKTRVYCSTIDSIGGITFADYNEKPGLGRSHKQTSMVLNSYMYMYHLTMVVKLY